MDYLLTHTFAIKMKDLNMSSIKTYAYATALLSSVYMISSETNAAVSYTNLNFNNWIDEGAATVAFFGYTYEKVSTMKFTNVATVNGVAIDATITASAMSGSGAGAWGGFRGNYAVGSDAPRGDIAFHYYGAKAGPTFVNLNLKFFVGGTSFTQSKSLDSFRLMMYDVDGEAAQDEFATAYMADGLYGFQRGTLMTATQNSDNVRFKGPGANQSETDTNGAFVLYYANTSSVNILMESMLDSGTNNPVFSALDGDQSMTMTGTFTSVALVPVPGAAALLGLAGVICGRRRRN